MIGVGLFSILAADGLLEPDPKWENCWKCTLCNGTGADDSHLWSIRHKKQMKWWVKQEGNGSTASASMWAAMLTEHEPPVVQPAVTSQISQESPRSKPWSLPDDSRSPDAPDSRPAASIEDPLRT